VRENKQTTMTDSIAIIVAHDDGIFATDVDRDEPIGARIEMSNMAIVSLCHDDMQKNGFSTTQLIADIIE